MIHFPIAFLLGDVDLDLHAWWRRFPVVARVVAWLFLAGVLTGVLTELAILSSRCAAPADKPNIPYQFRILPQQVASCFVR